MKQENESTETSFDPRLFPLDSTFNNVLPLIFSLIRPPMAVSDTIIFPPIWV